MNAIVATSTFPLKPCPFCGGSDLHIEGDSAVAGTWGVECDNPACEASGPRGCADPDDAAKKWNAAPRA